MMETIKGITKVIKLGRFGEEDNYSYGLRLYKKAEKSDKYIETLVTENNGQLWLKDYLTVGANGAGISGVNNDDINSSVRFWAGKEFDQREQAPFQVLHDGSVLATKLTIGGNSTIDGVDIKVVSKTTELAAIQDGQVVVAEGKVIANSILAEAVTAEKIKAGAIESDKIASNFILDISGESD